LSIAVLSDGSLLAAELSDAVSDCTAADGSSLRRVLLGIIWATPEIKILVGGARRGPPRRVAHIITVFASGCQMTGTIYGEGINTSL
jgi:hypothetical protein